MIVLFSLTLAYSVLFSRTHRFHEMFPATQSAIWTRSNKTLLTSKSICTKCIPFTYKRVFTLPIAAFSPFFYARRGSRLDVALHCLHVWYAACRLSVAIVAIATTDTKMKMKNSKATLRAHLLSISSTSFCFKFVLSVTLSHLSLSVCPSVRISRSFVSLLTLADVV